MIRMYTGTALFEVELSVPVFIQTLSLYDLLRNKEYIYNLKDNNHQTSGGITDE